MTACTRGHASAHVAGMHNVQACLCRGDAADAPAGCCRPFLLPCLVTGLACLASTLTNSIWLEETLPRLRSAKAARTSSDSHDAPLGLQIPLWRKLAQGPSNLAALLRGYSSLSGEAEHDSNGFSRDSEGELPGCCLRPACYAMLICASLEQSCTWIELQGKRRGC